jgi:hypothetical protein
MYQQQIGQMKKKTVAVAAVEAQLQATTATTTATTDRRPTCHYLD